MTTRARLSDLDWHDVADLCEQAAWACEFGYEAHTRKARDRATEWMRVMVCRAADNAIKAENRKKNKAKAKGAVL